MLKKTVFILAAAVFLSVAGNLSFGQEWDDEEKAMPRKEIRSPERYWTEESPYQMSWQDYPGRFGTPRAPIDRRWGPEAVERRFEGTRPFHPGELPPRPIRPAVRRFDKWFNELKGAYREGDREKVGLLIRKMEQFRQRARQRTESMRAERPFVPERFRERPLPEWGPFNDRQMESRRPAEGMREGWQRPRLEGDYPYGFQKHLRPEAMPKEFEAKGPAVVGPVPSREFCENCNCPHCTRMKEQLRQQDMHQKAREKSQDEEYSTKRPDTNEGDFDWDW